jgi:TPR repeat protein
MAGNDDDLCPFCRTPAPTSDEEVFERTMKRMEVDDAEAIRNRACDYFEGLSGLPQDRDKALELCHRAAELGYAASYNDIGAANDNGEGVERNEKKAIHYWELAVMRGNVCARYNLGTFETGKSNYNRALKHYMIAVGSGHNDSVKIIQQMFKHGYATKDDYAEALKAYQAYLSEIKSDDRDKAAAVDDELFKYYE